MENTPLPAIDGVIFDLDGTLWDTRAVCARGWNKVIRRSGLELPDVTVETVGSIMGLEPDEIQRRVFPTLPDAIRGPLMQSCYDAEVAELCEADFNDVLYPGVLDGLALLSERFTLCVVSNCQTGYLEAFLAHGGAGRLIADGECIGRTGKSKAENIALVAARQNLLSPVYVGDMDRDEAAAREAGVRFVHAGYGFGTASAQAITVPTFRALVELVLQS